jgi:hypothetical protein
VDGHRVLVDGLWPRFAVRTRKRWRSRRKKRCTGVSKSRKRRLGRSELKAFADWSDGRPETELNFKFYRQATNKIVGISDEAAKFLGNFF